MSFDLKLGNNLGNFGLLEHDISFDGSGRVVLVSGVRKLEQDIQKILFTSVNNFYNEYGTSIESLIGTNNKVEAIKEKLATQTLEALSYLKNLQDAQTRYQAVDGNEVIGQVLKLTVDYLYEITGNSNDATTYRVTIVVQNLAGKTVTSNRNVSLD